MKTQRWRPENKDLFIFFIYYDLVMVSLQKYPVLVLIFPTMIKYAIKHWFFDKRTLKIKTQTPRPEKQKPEKEHLKRNTWKQRSALIFFYWKWSNVSVMCSPSNELSVSKNHVIWNSLRKMLSPKLPQWMCFLHVELIAFKLQNLPLCRSSHLFSDSFL